MEEAYQQVEDAETQSEVDTGGEDRRQEAETGPAEPPAPNPHPPSPNPEANPEAELLEVRRRWLESHRRALLAENAGRVVPELVAGSTAEEMEASLEVARAAFEAARKATLAEIAATRIPAGSPVRQGLNPESMSPMEKIAYGLRRSDE